MIVRFGAEGSVNEFGRLVDQVLEDKDIKSLFIITCDANGFTPENLDPVLKKVSVPLIGGIYPAMVYGREKFDKGTLVVGLYHHVDYSIIKGLSDSDEDYEAQIDEQIPDMDNLKTMVVLVDGFSQRIAAFIESLFNIFGLDINYVGGGAGSLSLVQKPCLLTNEGLLQDAAALAPLDIESGIGVSHGWKSIKGPFRVTGSNGSVIQTLDWKPAFDVYKAIVDEHSGDTITADNFFDIAKSYPFGIAKMGTERVVRDPITIDKDKGIVCVGEVPEGAFVDVLNGNEASLIAAAGNALALSRKAYQSKPDKKVCFFIDCISRVLFLGDNFKKELDAVYRPDQPLMGACTIGEIANSGSDYLEFYNKTAVVSLLEA